MLSQKYSFLAAASTEIWWISLLQIVFILMCLCEYWIHISAAFPLHALEQCLCICAGVYLCANVHVQFFFFFFAADASHCVKCRGLNLSSESNKGGRPLESNRQFLAQKRFKYFLSICGRKETHGRENNNKWSAALLFFFCHPSHVPSLVVPHCQTLFPH